MLWSPCWPEKEELIAIIQDRMPSIRRSFTGAVPPSEIDPVRDLGLKQPVIVRMPGGASEPIPIGEDPSSIIFVHAALKPATSVQGYRLIYNFDDVADLLGWYEVTYEDGLVVTVPIRYKVNILDSAPKQRTYCHRADAVSIPSGERFFAFEWVNPRFGKTIESVRLRTPREHTGVSGRPLKDNGVTLAGIRVVSKRPVPAPGRAGSNGERGN